MHDHAEQLVICVLLTVTIIIPYTYIHVSDKYAGLRYAPDTVDLMNYIAVKFPTKWRDIGRGLGMEKHELDQIQAGCGWEQDTNRFFSEVFNRWYRGK